MREVIPFTTRDAWLEQRSRDLTSTEVATLFGRNPYSTLPELWQAKHDSIRTIVEENERMFWGNALQAAIMAGAREKHPKWIYRPCTDYIRDTELRAGASFDFVGTDEDDQECIFECKNVDGIVFKDKWPSDASGTEAPVHIELQVQHQMLVKGVKTAYIVALVGGNRLVVIRRVADEEVQTAMLVKIRQFWDSVDRNEPPALDWERDADFILSRYRVVIPKSSIDLSNVPGVRDYVVAYTDLGKQIQSVEIARKGMQARIVAMIGEAEVAFGEDYKVTTKPTKDGRSILVTWR